MYNIDMGGTSTQCNKIILLLIIVVLMYLLLCKSSSAFGGSIAKLVGGNGSVKKLTGSNYQDTISNNKVVFVKVYAPWCGYCTRMADDWKNLAKESAGRPGVVVAEVNADEEKDLASSLGARSFPTIVLVKDGVIKEKYDGERDTASMKTFLDNVR